MTSGRGSPYLVHSRMISGCSMRRTKYRPSV